MSKQRLSDTKLFSLFVVKYLISVWYNCAAIYSSTGVELINILKKLRIFCSCTWIILVHYIQESTKSRNAAYFFKNFHRIREANQKSVTKSQGFFTRNSRQRFPSYGSRPKTKSLDQDQNNRPDFRSITFHTWIISQFLKVITRSDITCKFLLPSFLKVCKTVFIGM